MEIGSGRLSFDPPITPDQVSPSAVDLRLSNQFTTFGTQMPGVKTTVDLTKIPDIEQMLKVYGEEQTAGEGRPFLLEPGKLVLAYTREYIKLPNYLAARVPRRTQLPSQNRSVHTPDRTHRPRYLRGSIEIGNTQQRPTTVRTPSWHEILPTGIRETGQPSGIHSQKPVPATAAVTHHLWFVMRYC